MLDAQGASKAHLQSIHHDVAEAVIVVAEGCGDTLLKSSGERGAPESIHIHPLKLRKPLVR